VGGGGVGGCLMGKQLLFASPVAGTHGVVHLRSPHARPARPAHQSCTPCTARPAPCRHQVMFMTGWSPAKSQPRAAKRGSADITLEQFAAQLESQGDGGAGADGVVGGGALPSSRKGDGA